MRPLPADIQLLALDFDGVLTDDRVYIAQDGTEYVACSRSDGMGFALLRRAGIDAVILSSETNPVVTARAKKLGIPAHQALDHKADTLRSIARDRNLDLAHVVYIGNDVNDAECLRIAGFAAVPADAHPSVKPLADLVLTLPGGHGAVRQLIDLILAPRTNAHPTKSDPLP